jgi:hypothetical protein
MANPTTNYGFVLPVPTDLVTDLPADFEVALQGVDTQMKTNADAAIAKSIVDAKGDLIAATAADTVSRLAVGTNGQLLAADSSAATGLAWVAAPASGGMTLLSTTTLSGSTVTISSISQSYRTLVAFISGVQFSGSPNQLLIRPNGSTSLIDCVGVRNPAGSAQTLGINAGQITTENNIETGFANAFQLQINNYASTTAQKPFNFYGRHRGNNPPNGYSINLAGGINTTSAITSLEFNSNGQNYNGGTVLLYGVA